MKQKTKFSIDLGLSNIKVKKMQIDAAGDYHIYASCTATSTLCSKCGKEIRKSYGTCKETVIEHLPIFDQRVFIHVNWPRFQCSTCDTTPTSSFHPSWLNETGDLTRAYENYSLKYLINSTIKDVSEKLRTTESVIEGILQRRIRTEINWAELSPRRLGMDEIALRKGHSHYLTIITDISTPKNIKVLAVLDGHKVEDVLPFLKSIPDSILYSLEGISVDMAAGYFSALQQIFEGKEDLFRRIVTIDRFHVSKLVGTQVDGERKKVIRALKKEYEDDTEKLEKLKYALWPFRHHPSDLADDEQARLKTLFEIAPELKECYELREKLYNIFELDSLSKEEARNKINEWCKESEAYETKGHKPFVSFVDTYRKFEDNILNYFTHRISSGPVEGLNNKIKVIKRRGFGFRNVTNFMKRLFLDINYKPVFIPAN
jgi:transposase